MPSNRRWSVSDGRKLATGILAVVAVFVVSASIGAQSWSLAAVGVATLAAGAAVYVVSAMNSRTFVYVPGTALVRSSSPPPATALQGRCEMQVLVRAPGMDDVAVRIRDGAVPVSKWPDPGARLPILVASSDPRRVRVLWDNVRTHGETAGVHADPDEVDPYAGETNDGDRYTHDAYENDRYADEAYEENRYTDETYDDRSYDVFDELIGDPLDGTQAPRAANDLGVEPDPYGDPNVVELDLIDPAGALREPEPPVNPGEQDGRAAAPAQAEPGEDGSGASDGPTPPVAPVPPRPRPRPADRPSPRPRRPADAAAASPALPPPAPSPATPPAAPNPPASDTALSGPGAPSPAGSGTAVSGPPARGTTGSGTGTPPVQVPRSASGHGRGRDRPALRIQHMFPALPAVRAIPDPAPPADESPEDATSEISDAYLAVTRPPGQGLAGGQVHGVGVTLSVSNLGRSVAFYRDMLGFQQIDIGPGSAVLESGDGRIVLRRENDVAPVDRRLVYLLLEVPDVHAAYEDLRARGVEFVHHPRAVSRYEQLELWSAAFRDPDGHGIALTRWEVRR